MVVIINKFHCQMFSLLLAALTEIKIKNDFQLIIYETVCSYITFSYSIKKFSYQQQICWVEILIDEIFKNFLIYGIYAAISKEGHKGGHWDTKEGTGTQWDTKEGTGKSMKTALYEQWCPIRLEWRRTAKKSSP